MIRITFEALLPLLLQMLWLPSPAQDVYKTYPTYYFGGAGYGGFQVATKPPQILLGTVDRNSGMLAADHEYQHGWYWLKFGTNVTSTIKKDFTKAAESNACAANTVWQQSRDIDHWPHFVINCVSRQKTKLPRELYTKYYEWLAPDLKYTVRIPVMNRSK